MQGSTHTSSYDVRDQAPAKEPVAIQHNVSPGYFRAMGIPVLRGRDLLPGENDAVVVSASFARRHWPQGDPLAGAVSWDRTSQPYHPVVGVVGDVRHAGLAQEPVPEFYQPLAYDPTGGSGTHGYFLVLRGGTGPGVLVPVLERALREMDPDLPFSDAMAMDEVLDINRQGARTRGILLGSFGALALVLAGVGIYAVVHVLTSLRTREIGVRMALGAGTREVLGLVLRQGLRLVLAGIGLGALLSLAGGRILQAEISGVLPWDPATLGAVAALLGATGLLACLLPALRAARVEPTVALRSE
jgi:hypothetical protein